MRLKPLARRCDTRPNNRDEIRTSFAIGRGRGQAGFRTSRRLFPNAKRRKGGGNHTNTPDIGFELFQLMDTVGNLESTAFSWMLMMQARIIIKYIDRSAEDEGVPANIPATEGTGWLSRWRRGWSVSTRSVNLVYKVSRANLFTRAGIVLRNHIRLRTLWR